MFLPIANRELRVAARKRSTNYIRVAGAGAALLIGGGALLLESLSGRAGSGGSIGRGLFTLLTWLTLAATIVSGLFLTADCLSEEKREGTLGFLFLTDLRGYDVVFGKLVATSLRGFYAMLAALPVMGVTLVLGGITGEQFWKTAMALVTVLFVSLASGLLASSVSRDSQRAMLLTLVLLVLLAAAGPLTDALLAEAQNAPFTPVLSVSSPVYLFWTANAWGRTPYWTSLMVNQGLGWTLFALACLLIPRTWQERPRSAATRAQRWRWGGAANEAAVRARLLQGNPVVWLNCRERWQALLLWIMAALSAGGLLLAWAAATLGVDKAWLGLNVSWMAYSYFEGLVILGVYLSVASQAGRFFIEGRRSGLLELLLVTPLQGREIVRGQWLAFVRKLGPPLLICLSAHLIAAFMSQKEQQRFMSNIPAPAPPPAPASPAGASTTTAVVVTTTYSLSGANSSTNPPSAASTPTSAPPPWVGLIPWVTAPLTLLTTAANLAALIWFGMWLGLSARNTGSCTMKTLLFVQIIPWFVISFVGGLLLQLLLLPIVLNRGLATSASGSFYTFYWLGNVAAASCLALGKDIGFILWARRKLFTQFREKVMAILAPQPIPPRLPPTPAPPLLPPPLPPSPPAR
jgi:hypothetical protein